MHRPSLQGLEHLPDKGPFLLVANHSGAMAVAELLCLLVLNRQHFRCLRLTPLAHPFAFHLWPLSILIRALGAVPSSVSHAKQALAAGSAVLIFPGGDHEVSRPFWQASRVDFNGRQGFLRLARDAGVPIVPMGISGSHLSAPVLWRSTLVLPWLLVLPKIFGLKRFPFTLLALAGVLTIFGTVPAYWGWIAAAGLSWLWMICLLSMLPFVPTTIRMRLGAPIAPRELFSAGDDLIPAYTRVTGCIQELVTTAKG